MEEGVIPLCTLLENPSDTFMDFNYVDELFFQGCWLETNLSELSHFDPSTPFSPFEPVCRWPTLDPNNGESHHSPSNPGQDERQSSSRPDNPPVTQSSLRPLLNKPQSHITNHMDSSPPSENHPTERWWIGLSVMDRLIQALGYIKNCSGDKDVLVQVWIRVTKEGKRVLTTDDQPFSLDLNCPKLARYREISVNCHFSADEDSKEILGLPGRLFRNKVPDVRFFSWEEYPRVGHAQQYDVRGTLAVPILEQGSGACLGVIEVVLTRQKIQYRPELESVCKALEAVDLRSAESLKTRKVKTSGSSYQAALPEILDVLRTACETHRLPLAQTWVPCKLQGKGDCWHHDGNLKDCVAPVNSACLHRRFPYRGLSRSLFRVPLVEGSRYSWKSISN